MIVNVEPTWWDSLEHQCCSAYGLKCKPAGVPDKDTVLLGSVEYCRTWNKWAACDPYPEWLPMGRWTCRGIPLPMGDAFYKPADIPKRFDSCVMHEPPATPWVASRVLKFVREWRAYVIDGVPEAVYCYSDLDHNSYKFPWEVPSDVTAAIDFGLTNDGRTLPIEVNDPYAVGWYGNLQNGAVYAKFVEHGWSWTLNNRRVLS